MSCFNFIIIKVNGADVSNLPYEDAVQVFLNAKDPILVEVRRRCIDESNKLSFFNYDSNNSPTLAVIASSNSNNLYDGEEFCRNTDETATSSLTTIKRSQIQKPATSSISCQTESSVFHDCKSKEMLFVKGDSDFDGTFYQIKRDRTSINDQIMDGSLRTEFDIEEITLIKSQSTENLGLTISYSTDDLSGSDSGSDEWKETDEECNLNDFFANKCKVYVSDIVPNSLADRDGRLRQGDRILQINGKSIMENADPNKLLTENKYSMTILVSRQAYVGDDDFLDSAVYCDDKECQYDRHQSSVCECEQNTFSSKSSTSKQEGESCSPTTLANIYPILPITVEKVSDLFNHANIKAQLESVNKEISLLNSQISIMKLQQLTTVNESSGEKQSYPLKVKETPLKIITKTTTNETAHEAKQNVGLKPEIEVEHIYETIPEDIESDPYYCSPYEGVNELRVEQWLTSIGCKQNINPKNRRETSAGYHPSTRLQKFNTNLDDYDNSSSAYNTGGSCNSGRLPLDQQSKPTRDRYNSRKLSFKCKNVLHGIGKPNQIESKRGQTFAAFNKELRSTCRNSNISIWEKPQPSSYINRQTAMPSSTPVPISSNISSIDADSDGHSTLVAKSSVYKMCQYKAVEEDKGKDLSEKVWKVKRRPDGTRYISRRVTKKTSATVPDDGTTQMLDQNSISTICYKKQTQKLKERRFKHKNLATPSKDKHHPQHWLV